MLKMCLVSLESEIHRSTKMPAHTLNFYCVVGTESTESKEGEEEIPKGPPPIPGIHCFPMSLSHDGVTYLLSIPLKAEFHL